MRHDKIIAANPARLQPSIFTCTCCEVSEHRLTQDAPEGWIIEFIDGTGYAFCGDCKIDVPESCRAAGSMATRIGVGSQLDAVELIEMDEEDLRHARRLAGIAQAERVGRHVFPVIIAAILLFSAASMVSQGMRWISL